MAVDIESIKFCIKSLNDFKMTASVEDFVNRGRLKEQQSKECTMYNLESGV
jgi:hypothetical protein